MRKDIPVLTSFRFFAALAVVIYHYEYQKRAVFPLWASSFGFEAVSFFFVLSGFILTYAHARSPQSIDLKIEVEGRTFLARRAGRILPAYILGLAIAAPFFVYGTFYSKIIPLSLFLTGLILVPFLAQAWYPPAASLWNLPAWSLSVESFFYVLFPILARTVNLLRPVPLLLLSLVFVAVLEQLRRSIPTLLENHFTKGNLEAFAGFFPPFHLPQFVLGIAVARIFLLRRPLTLPTSETLLAFSLALVSIVVYAKPQYSAMSSPTILSTVFALLIYAGASASGVLSALFSGRTLVLLGEASYVMYILHIPITLWWGSTVARYLTLTPQQDFAAYFAVVIVASLISLQWIEKPARALIVSRFGR